MKTKIRPLGDRIVVKRLEDMNQTPGGIVIPDNAKEKPQQGEVIFVGPGAVMQSGERRVIDVKQGDKVIFGKYSGTEIKLNGDELLILREEDIMGVVEA